jgi:hypothetical protein
MKLLQHVHFLTDVTEIYHNFAILDNQTPQQSVQTKHVLHIPFDMYHSMAWKTQVDLGAHSPGEYQIDQQGS